MVSDAPEAGDEAGSSTTLTWVAAIVVTVLLATGGGVLAFVRVTRVRTTSHTAHMRQFMFLARISEEATKADIGRYESLSSDLHDLCPRGASPSHSLPWDLGCGSGKDSEELRAWFQSVKPDERFDFGVAILAIQPGASPPGLPRGLPPLTPPAQEPWYVVYEVQERGDGNADYVVGASYSKDITVAEADDP